MIGVNRFVADEPVAFTKPGDVNDPTLYPFYQGVYGYRSQSIYTVAALQQSGLKASEVISGFSFHVGWSVLDPVIDVRIAVAWTASPSFATSSSFQPTTVVHGPVTVEPSRFVSRQLALIFLVLEFRVCVR